MYSFEVVFVTADSSECHVYVGVPGGGALTGRPLYACSHLLPKLQDPLCREFQSLVCSCKEMCAQ